MVSQYEPESKRQSIEWKHADSPETRMFWAQLSLNTVFWDIRKRNIIDTLKIVQLQIVLSVGNSIGEIHFIYLMTLVWITEFERVVFSVCFP